MGTIDPPAGSEGRRAVGPTVQVPDVQKQRSIRVPGKHFSGALSALLYVACLRRLRMLLWLKWAEVS